MASPADSAAAAAKSAESVSASASAASSSSSSSLPLRYRVNSTGQLQDTDGAWIIANFYRQLLLLLYDCETLTPSSEVKLHPKHKARVLTALLTRISQLAAPTLDESSPALKGLINTAGRTLESARRSGLRRCIRVMRGVVSGGDPALSQLEQDGNQLDDQSMFDALNATEEPNAEEIAAAERQAESADAWKLEKSDPPDNDDEERCDACAEIQAVNHIRTANGHQPVEGPNSCPEHA